VARKNSASAGKGVSRRPTRAAPGPTRIDVELRPAIAVVTRSISL
jgi:hypothetical protein